MHPVTLDEGEHITCTIVNDDETAYFSLFKQVNNNHGGNAGVDDFGLTVGGLSVVSSEFLEVNSNTPIALDEAGLSGYSFVSITGDPGCPQVLGGTVTLDEGEYMECFIVNEDQTGTLIVKKVVVNDDGGTLNEDDFSFEVNGGGVQSFEADGENVLAVDADTYTIIEPQVSGYSTTYDNCDQVVVSNGETETCIITNDDAAATLTVNKVLMGPFFLAKDLGSFDILVDGNVEESGIVDQQVRTDPNDPISTDVDGTTGPQSLSAGSHIISEQVTPSSNTNLNNYQMNITCEDSNNNPVTVTNVNPPDPFLGPRTPWNINLANGQDVTCSIRNFPLGTAQGANQVIVL